MIKYYNEQFNIGKVKYVVNFHDGKETHKDGSAFYNIRTFSNKKEKALFITRLKRDGYIYRH